MKYQWANPEYLYFLIIIPFLIIWYIIRRKKSKPVFIVSSSAGFAKSNPSLKQRLRHLGVVLRLSGLALLIVALARPQSSSTKQIVSTEGVDIVIAIDVSTSMLAEDFKPSRIDAAKKYALEFIDKRVNDRIGLVIFSGESFTQCPITIDHEVLKGLFENIKSGMIEDGTAIGMGLATAVTRLKDSKAKSKVIILLTDGINNTGFIAPLTASEIAKSFGIKVYTIGVGTRGKAPYPLQTPFGKQYRNVDVEIDEEILQNIAGMTNGKYFRATNNKTLEQIYSEIDKLEKTKTDVATFRKYSEEFFWFAVAGFAMIFLEMLFRYIFIKSIP